MDNQNLFIVSGHLVKDPELRQTKTGSDMAVFSIGNTTSYQAGSERKETNSFFNCVLIGKLAKTVVTNVKKGSLVSLEAQVNQTKWQDKDGKDRTGYNLLVNKIYFNMIKKDDIPKQNVTSDEYPF